MFTLRNAQDTRTPRLALKRKDLNTDCWEKQCFSIFSRGCNHNKSVHICDGKDTLFLGTTKKYLCSVLSRTRNITNTNVTFTNHEQDDFFTTTKETKVVTKGLLNTNFFFRIRKERSGTNFYLRPRKERRVERKAF